MDQDFDYGPLQTLIGVWTGDQGEDIAPESDGTETNPFYETMIFEPAGQVVNAESQTLVSLRYYQVVKRKSNDKVFHDQIGYWIWDRKEGIVTQTLTIPRGLALVAQGRVSTAGEKIIFSMSCAENTISQSQFLSRNAQATHFEYSASLLGDMFEYSQTTLLDIYGKKSFKHTDKNCLIRKASSL